MNRLLRWLLLGILVLLGLLVATCASAPLRWWWKPATPARVQVLDKTVPHPDYREHAALYWVLRHEKLAAMDGSRDWPTAENYLGFHPDEAAPGRGVGDTLRPEDLQDADLLYLADSYGVYEGDYETGAAALDYSPLIYGGLSLPEVRAIEDYAAAGGDLVAEFNTLASPTSGAARERLEELLGIDWTGWSGRRFEDLANEGELPRWAPRFWREQQGEDWNFRGPGYVLVHEDTRIVILREPLDVLAPSLVLDVTSDHPLLAGALSGTPFNYWFDIVAQRPGALVAATFRFDPTDSGSALLAEAGLPREFPAVVFYSDEPLRAYFAGDFADSASGLGPHWAEGLPWLNRAMMEVWFPRGSSQEQFYWGFYIPVVRTLLERYENE